MKRCYTLRVTGVVQGVGFRPTVWRLATERHLSGCVANDTGGVVITLWIDGGDDALRGFVDALRREAPPLSRIDSITVTSNLPDASSAVPDGFTIAPSDSADSARVTDISPDAAICRECLADMQAPGRRHDYPLTNCTHCGPRFSIMKGLPYDRPLTTMARFTMCDGCHREYTDPADRRFHAQPVCCSDCGPRYRLGDITDQRAVARAIAAAVLDGDIVMMKGIGGYNLICDAGSDDALRRLRTLKHRPRKPFAVMAASVADVRRFVLVSAAEEGAMTSWRAPIVILDLIAGVSPLLAPGLSTLGVMLPYMGLHHMIMEETEGVPLVVTSANRPGSPIIADDADALAYGRENSLPVVTLDRAIHNRVDDSVVRVIDGEPRIFRRGRGYAPERLRVSDDNADGAIALGADISSQWALGRGRDIISSQYIGPLVSEGTELFLRESIDKISALCRFTPRRVVVDAHPDYLSSRIGREIASQAGLPVTTVWHHHAHALAVMAEYGLDGPELALVLDGTGAGPDGTVWGSELLDVTRGAFKRLAHGPQLPMPGGDAAAREPWRMAVSLWTALGRDVGTLPAVIVEEIGADRLRAVASMVSRRLNSPLSSGAGRLWDAMACLAGLAMTSTYEAEAPVLLEGLASTQPSSDVRTDETIENLLPLLDRLIGQSDGHLFNSARAFHELYAALWVNTIVREARRLGRSRVILTGGVLQNRLLAEMLCRGLRQASLTPLMGRQVPPGDGSIPVGQLYFKP